MIFFLPNFDVRKEQVSNTKREHGQTDARKPSKSICTKNDPTRIQTRKASNGCTKSLKSDFPTRSRSQPFAEARRDKRGARPTHHQQNSTSGPLQRGPDILRAPQKHRAPQDLRTPRELRAPRELKAPRAQSSMRVQSSTKAQRSRRPQSRTRAQRSTRVQRSQTAQSSTKSSRAQSSSRAEDR